MIYNENLMRKRLAIYAIISLAYLCNMVSTVRAAEISTVELVKTAGPAVVTVMTSVSGQSLSFGSGFNVDSMGIIVTNYHVVRGADEIEVKFPNGDKFKVDKLIGLDLERDIAILRINGFDLPTVKMGNSNEIEIGEPTIAIGNAQGFENTVSNGIASGKRTLDHMWILQTTTPISPGSSGGPLFNNKGGVIAVTTLTWIEAGTQNLNFCIPINYVRGMIAAPRDIAMNDLLTSAKKIPTTGPSDLGHEYSQLVSKIDENSILTVVQAFTNADVNVVFNECIVQLNQHGFKTSGISVLQWERLLSSR